MADKDKNSNVVRIIIIIIVILIIIILVFVVIWIFGGTSSSTPTPTPPTPTQCSFTYSITGNQEVPPVSTGAIGTGTASLNAAETQLTFNFTFSELSTSLTAAHFHMANAGINGSIVRTLTGDITGGTGSGVWRSTDSEPLTPALVSALKSNGIYINIHTTTHPGGEIRGQLISMNC